MASKTKLRLKKKDIFVDSVVEVDQAQMQRCLNVYKKDIYIRNAIDYCISSVMQGGVYINVGTLKYPGLSNDISKQVQVQIGKALEWFYLFGFVLFHYEEKKAYTLRDSDINTESEGNQRKKRRRNNVEDIENSSIDYSFLRKEKNLDRRMAGISSYDAKESPELNSIMDSLSGEVLGHEHHNNVTQPEFPLPNSAYDRSSNSSSNNTRKSFKGLNDEKIKEGIKVATNILLNNAKAFITELDAGNGDLDFFVPDPTTTFAKFYRYTELGNPVARVFVKLTNDPDDISISEDDSESDNEKTSKGDIDENFKTIVYDSTGIRHALKNKSYASLTANLISADFSPLPGFNPNYLYENHPSSQVNVQADTTNGDEDKKKNEKKPRKKRKKQYLYQVYTITAPDEYGQLDSHVSRLIDEYDSFQLRMSTSELILQRGLYPTMIVQKVKPKTGLRLNERADEKSSTERNADTIRGVGNNISSAHASMNSFSSQNNQGASSGNSNACRLQADASILPDLQRKIHLQVLRDYNTKGMYTKAFRQHVQPELPPQFVFDLNTVQIQEGYEFVSLHTPTADAGASEARENYIVLVASTFRVPKKALFDTEQNQKWKSDTTSESDNFVTGLIAVREMLKDFFYAVYITKNGYNFKVMGRNVDNFVKQEGKIIEILVSKAIELAQRLPAKLITSQEEFLRGANQEIDESRQYERNKRQLANLSMDVDRVLLSKMKQNTVNPPKPRFVNQTTTKTPGPDGKTGKVVQQSKQQVEDPELAAVSTNYVENMLQDSARLSGVNFSTEDQPNLDLSRHLKEIEKDRNLIVLQKFMAFSKDVLQKWEDLSQYVNQHRWMSVNLSFKHPMIMSMDSIQKIQQITNLPQARLIELVNNKYGFDTPNS